MAQATPRVFWNVVRHGEVGPACTFQQALSTLLPAPKWAEVWANLEVRERRLSKKAQEYAQNQKQIQEALGPEDR
jgi:hypothetical protein